MSNSTDQSIDDLINQLGHNINYDDLALLPAEFLEEYSLTFNTNEDFRDVVGSVLFSSDNAIQTPSGFSPENNNSNHQELSNLVSQAVALPTDMPLNPTCLQMVAQPYYGTKLRYRSDYEKNENRLGVLKNRNKDSSYQGPAIRIPEDYLNANGEYFIRVSLVTVEYKQTNLHYFHPYELEHPSNEQLNDRSYNSVWFVIQPEDYTGIKSFPSLRIVKKRASDFKTYGDLHVFDCYDQDLQNHSLQQLNNVKDTIQEYSLEKSQLAFTVGRKTMNNGELVTVIFPTTTVYSEVMEEGVNKESDGDNDIPSLNDRPISSPPICRVYKYAPRYGFDTSHEDMVIFLMNKLEPKKYGELKIVFECNTSTSRWSEAISDLDIKDRMVSFKTPIYPYQFDTTQGVDVILTQDNRMIGTIKYFYLATLDKCSRCQSNTIEIQTNVIPNMPNKRSACMITGITFVDDCVVPVSDNSTKFQQSLSEPPQESSASSSLATQSNSVSLPSVHVPQTTGNPQEQMMNTLADSIESLFINNDQAPFLRLCRSFLKKSPQLIHNAIDNNNTDVLLKFLPLATINILQQKNEYGETVLLHVIRLNQTEFVQILLENKNFEKLLEDIDAKNNNIFHIIAMYSTSLEILDFLIKYIHEKFDCSNQDHFTPLQLSIFKNNLLITKIFFKYFNKNIHQTKNLTGDNLIHLAVRHGDLAMIKYLIEDGQLIEQGKQSNLTMTPSELAQSLQRQDIIEYFNEIYPEHEIDEDDSSDDDDD